MDIKTALTLTEAQIELLNGPTLAQAYNVIATSLKLDRVNKFSTRAAGIKRLLALVETARALVAKQAATKTLAPKTTTDRPGHRRTARPAAEPKAPRQTVSSVARALILSGLTNEAVFAQLQTQFGLPASKKHYPCWYRAELRRAGQLVQAA